MMQPREADKILQVLSDADVPCPDCGYNLRALTVPRCPECAMELSVQSLMTRPTLWYGAWGVIVAAVAAGVMESVHRWWLLWRLGRLEYGGVGTAVYPAAMWASHIYWLSVIPALVGVFMLRRRLVRLPGCVIWPMAVGCVVLTALAHRRVLLWPWGVVV